MKNVRVLDCTLRDGGRIINCAFLDNEIKDIVYRLANAKVDIVEIGFLRDENIIKNNGNSTFFNNVSQIEHFVGDKKKNTMYTAFVDFGMYKVENLKLYDGNSIDAIRFGFTKKNFIEEHNKIIKDIESIKDKGYKVFVQGVNTLNYSDKELLELVEDINNIKSYSFGIVDTYGAMYIDDVERIYRLIDNNLDDSICINFHSHNNYQLSFSFAQEIIKLSSSRRQVIIDSTLYGMGKTAGNLNTELIIEYLVRKYHYDYEFNDILDVIDDYIYKYSSNYKWGYSIPAMLSGIYKSHPNNVMYLTEKFRLDTKDISNLLYMIEPEKRQRYDYSNIEKLYIEYIASKVDDYNILETLREIINGREVLVIVPGNTLNTHKNIIDNYVIKNNPFIITVNFISDIENSYSFFGNQKRYNKLLQEQNHSRVIVSSNIKSNSKNDMIVNYYDLISRGYKYFENSTIMLLNLLKKLNVNAIVLAGFDGFDNKFEMNYSDISFDNDRHKVEFDELNREIREMFKEIVCTLKGKCTFKIITPSIYKDVLEDC